MGAGIKLIENGYPCTILELNSEAGGLAGSFKINNKHFPLGYHHVLYQDKPLLQTLKKLGIYQNIRWKKGKVLFAINNQIYNLENPLEFLKFPLPFLDKIRFIKLLAYCMFRKNWDSDLGNAETWLDNITGKNVRQTIFDPLMDIKYGLPSKELSANWIGSRLHYQEFSKPLGYLPGTDWTKILTDKMVERFQGLGGIIITEAKVKKINLENGQFKNAVYQKDSKDNLLDGEVLINTAPPHVFLSLCDYHNKELEKIKYLDALSLILETEQKLPRELYLLSCLKPRYSFGGIFMLSSLNNTIGVQNNNTVINFFTTLSKNYEYLRNKSSEELLEIYQKDFEKIFGFRLNPLWHHLTLIKNYSPEFLKGYLNPNQRGNIKGIYFAGNYLTYPIITSTGSAIASGERVAKYIIKDYHHAP